MVVIMLFYSNLCWLCHFYVSPVVCLYCSVPFVLSFKGLVGPRGSSLAEYAQGENTPRGVVKCVNRSGETLEGGKLLPSSD